MYNKNNSNHNSSSNNNHNHSSNNNNQNNSNMNNYNNSNEWTLQQQSCASSSRVLRRVKPLVVVPRPPRQKENESQIRDREGERERESGWKLKGAIWETDKWGIPQRSSSSV